MQFAQAALERSDAAVIVTPTSLLASVAAHQLAVRQLKEGRQAWERRSTLSLGNWLTAKWREARYGKSGIPLLLSPAQEHLLWRQIIQQHHPDLFDSNAAASLASRAAETIQEWQLPQESAEWADHEDARHFQTWYRSFRDRCREECWITRAELRGLIPGWISRQYCSVEPTLFAGFDVIWPALKAVVDASGNRAQFVQPAHPRPRTSEVLEFVDFDEEIDHAARWARQIVESRPGEAVGVFVAGLERHLQTIEDSFRKVFYPPSIVHGGFDRERAAFQIHAGNSLLDEPLISGALLLLELSNPPLKLNDASAVLRSRYLKGPHEEASSRALADVDLRRSRWFEVDLRNLEFACDSCPTALHIWRKLRQLLARRTEEMTFSGWASFFGELLRVVGWPGDHTLTSHEQDVVDYWKDSLSELTSLGLVGKAETFSTAVRELRRILAAAKSSRPELAAPVQILDASSAAGLTFDATIAIGMCEGNWPVYRRPSSLIPLKIQRAAGLPGSTAESRRKQAVCDTRAILASAPHVLISYSGHLPPIMAEYGGAGSKPAIWTGKTAVQSFPQAVLELLEDRQGPSYKSAEVLAGGTSIIKSQSLCAFRAFAEHRLHAVSPEDPCLGFDARDRGTFLHKALELVWRELRNSENLSRIAQSELDELVRRAIDLAVIDRQDDGFRLALSAAERQRLRELITDWLELERNRKHSFSVEILEERREIEIGGLRFALRVDRIDRLNNGRTLLVDYKSGKISSRVLDCPRPKEPQLLVYAATEPGIDGMIFAQIRPDEIRPIGITRSDYWNAPRLVCKQFDARLEEMRNEVERLATEFVSGVATINPESNNTCKYCGASALCRRSEWSLEAENGDS